MKEDITEWVEQHQFEIEAWESDTSYNFDICLEAERINTGLCEVQKFLNANHMSYVLNAELTEDKKAALRKLLPENLEIRDAFERNCYYNIFKKQLK